ncbi:uncharacterized protein LOC143305277 [Osmia lignaria lignaria]|uniref:uncharacterized protein LOC143305277 n=1 Tax=Osmia lignaria lignaria TaxID=1437193 RepID=UPI00402BE2ED
MGSPNYGTGKGTEARDFERTEIEVGKGEELLDKPLEEGVKNNAHLEYSNAIEWTAVEYKRKRTRNKSEEDLEESTGEGQSTWNGFLWNWLIIEQRTLEFLGKEQAS